MNKKGREEKAEFPQLCFDVVWIILSYVDLLTLSTSFRVNRTFSRVAKYRNFWKTYCKHWFDYEFSDEKSTKLKLLLSCRNEKFEDFVKIQRIIIKAIDEENLEILQKYDVQKYCYLGMKSRWCTSGKMETVNLLIYAILKDKTNVVRYFVESGIFSPNSTFNGYNTERDTITFSIIYNHGNRNILRYLLMKSHLRNPPLHGVSIDPKFSRMLMRSGKSIDSFISSDVEKIKYNSDVKWLYLPIPSLLVALDDMESLELLVKSYPSIIVSSVESEFTDFQNCVSLSILHGKFDFTEYLLSKGGYPTESILDRRDIDIPHQLRERLENTYEEKKEHEKKFLEELLSQEVGVDSSVQIFVKSLTGKTFSFIVKPKVHTVDTLKFLIFMKTGIPKIQQRLLFGGKELKNDQMTLDKYDVKSECTIHLVLRLR